MIDARDLTALVTELASRVAALEYQNAQLVGALGEVRSDFTYLKDYCGAAIDGHAHRIEQLESHCE
jgi:hypothetical protein